MTHQDRLVAVAKAEDTEDLLNHIAWSDVVKPRMQKAIKDYSNILVNEALGFPLPQGVTREQVAGRAYGIRFIMDLIEQVLKDGERALDALQVDNLQITIQRL